MCLTIHTKKWFLRAGLLGAPPISLKAGPGSALTITTIGTAVTIIAIATIITVVTIIANTM